MLLLCAGRAGCGLRAVRAALRRNVRSVPFAAPRPAPLRTAPHRPAALLVPAGLALGCVGAAARGREGDARPVPPPVPVPAAPRPEPEFQWAVFWALLRPQLLALSAAVVLALGAALLNVQIPVFLGQLVDVVARGAQTHVVGYLRAARPPALRLLGLYALQALLTFGYIALLSRVGERVAASMRKELFVSLLRQDVAFFDARRTGHLVARLTADVQDFKSSFKLIVSQGVRGGAQALCASLRLYALSPRLSALLLLLLPALLGAAAVIRAALRERALRAREQVAKASAVADEALGNVRTVRAFAMEEQQAGLYCSEAERCAVLSQRLGVGIAAFQGMANLTLNGIVLGTIFVGGSLMAEGQLSAGDLMSFLVASQTMQKSLANISILFGQVVRGMSAGARVFEFMTLEPHVPLRGGDTIPGPDLRGHISFQGVSFSYPTRPEHRVLRDFNLTVLPGETVAIVGPSGGGGTAVSGKSTVAALLERFYEPTHGTVTLDGRDIASLDPSWLRGHVIGFISQEPVLFGTSIMENIRFGKPGASDEEVFAAARAADADAFIRAFPDGYGTVVGERGAALSGGQRQRVALARALLKAPAVLVLDEATSALDAESERAVQAALERAARGRTVLLIAHRLSTVRDAHRIVVLAGGRVAEVGTHEELLRRGGMYAQLMREQSEERSSAE